MIEPLTPDELADYRLGLAKIREVWPSSKESEARLLATLDAAQARADVLTAERDAALDRVADERDRFETLWRVIGAARAVISFTSPRNKRPEIVALRQALVCAARIRAEGTGADTAR